MGKGTEQREQLSFYFLSLLKKISSTYYLGISRLDNKERETILCGYLLFRVLDLIEDNVGINYSDKVALLNQYEESFLNRGDFELPANLIRSSIENELILKLKDLYAFFHYLSDKDQLIIISTYRKMKFGMIKFLLLQKNSEWYTINSLSDLDEYCYYVAGVVGEMLYFVMLEKFSNISKRSAIKFGIGLQVANILKDLEEDSKRKVLFVPLSCLDFNEVLTRLSSENSVFISRANLDSLCLKALNNLHYGYMISTLIPIKEVSTRLFCITPLYLALASVAKCCHIGQHFISSRAQVVDLCLKSASSNIFFQKKYQELASAVKYTIINR